MSHRTLHVNYLEQEPSGKKNHVHVKCSRQDNYWLLIVFIVETFWLTRLVHVTTARIRNPILIKTEAHRLKKNHNPE
jgi:hypothetical protein